VLKRRRVGGDAITLVADVAKGVCCVGGRGIRGHRLVDVQGYVAAVPNAAIVALSDRGTVCLRAAEAATDLLVDPAGIIVV
jgi:hypothetical protein